MDQLGKWNRQARYSLIVGIQTPEAKVDIYTPVLSTGETTIQI